MYPLSIIEYLSVFLLENMRNCTTTLLSFLIWVMSRQEVPRSSLTVESGNTDACSKKMYLLRVVEYLSVFSRKIRGTLQPVCCLFSDEWCRGRRCHGLPWLRSSNLASKGERSMCFCVHFVLSVFIASSVENSSNLNSTAVSVMVKCAETL